MGELVGENYGDNHSEQGVPEQQGTGPGEGRLDEPATTGTHRGWGDPQTGEQQPGEDQRDDDED
jgi:hypothetical protein